MPGALFLRGDGSGIRATHEPRKNTFSDGEISHLREVAQGCAHTGNSGCGRIVGGSVDSLAWEHTVLDEKQPLGRQIYILYPSIDFVSSSKIFGVW